MAPLRVGVQGLEKKGRASTIESWDAGVRKEREGWQEGRDGTIESWGAGVMKESKGWHH